MEMGAGQRGTGMRFAPHDEPFCLIPLLIEWRDARMAYAMARERALGSESGRDSDSRVIARIAAGDREALAELYREWRRPLFAYLVQLTAGDTGLALGQPRRVRDDAGPEQDVAHPGGRERPSGILPRHRLVSERRDGVERRRQHRPAARLRRHRPPDNARIYQVAQRIAVSD